MGIMGIFSRNLKLQPMLNLLNRCLDYSLKQTNKKKVNKLGRTISPLSLSAFSTLLSGMEGMVKRPFISNPGTNHIFYVFI